MTVKYSVIIPTLNEEKFLPKLLESLAGQTDKNFEVIVVDGSSKDKTVAVAQSFLSKVPKLQIMVSKKACLPSQRNSGAALASGEWLVFVDADSILMPYFIERLTVFIKKTAPAWFTTWCLPDSDVVNDAIFTLFTNIFWESMLIIKRPAAPGPLNCIRRTLFRSVGGYNETQKYNEDLEFGLRLTKHGATLSFLRETLYVWSMRRIRKEGKVKLMNQYILSIIPILLFKRPFKVMPGYVMGGHVYEKKQKSHTSKVLKRYEIQLKRFAKELFE
jgi:glycosyltransferase involved in cell wall biosynthesis